MALAAWVGILVVNVDSGVVLVEYVTVEVSVLELTLVLLPMLVAEVLVLAGSVVVDVGMYSNVSVIIV